MTNNIDLELLLPEVTIEVIKQQKSDEFVFSLGSQLFADKFANEGFGLIDKTITSVVINNEGKSSDLIEFTSIETKDFNTKIPDTRLQLNSLSNQVAIMRDFSQTITLNNAYDSNYIDFDDPVSSGFSISKERGRLRIFGEYKQQHVNVLPIVDDQNIQLPTSIRGSVSTVDLTSPHLQKDYALESKYYLEATYSFKPSFKGKVSFRKSAVDAFASEEEFKLEGIVDASRNIQIKAGYNNEARPEISDPKVSLKTKVWTEFILKF